MVYGHVMIRKSFGALPVDEEDEEDIQWMREHRIKAFRAVTTGNYGDRVGYEEGASAIGRGEVGKGKEKISN